MIPLKYGLVLAITLFTLGLTGLVIRRNFLFMLINLEIMMNSSALAFVMASNYWCQVDGQLVCIFIISLSAVETSIGLAFLLRLYRRYHKLDIDLVSEMHG